MASDDPGDFAELRGDDIPLLDTSVQGLANHYRGLNVIGSDVVWHPSALVHPYPGVHDQGAQVVPIILPDSEGRLARVEPAADDVPIYRFKIVCGCGLYTTDSLGDWDDHLAELVAEDDGNIKLHVDRTSVILVRQTESERRQYMSVDDPIPYTTEEIQ